MSLTTWKREHYPIPAGKCKKADAVAHSLQKYLGTRRTALKRHGVRRDGTVLWDKEYKAFYFSGDTCALCWFYRDKDGKCSPKCPIIVESGQACESAGSLWGDWCNTDDPEPMIRALRQALRKQAALALNRAGKK